jgi:hypothetical protein
VHRSQAACIAHKSLRVCERCRLALPKNLRSPGREQLGNPAPSVQITPVQSRFQHAWTTYRRLRFFVIGLFVAFMLELRYFLFLPGLVFALTFLGYYFSATYLANWKCPRCHQPFFRGSFVRSLFGGKCFYCDLPKWSADEALQRNRDYQRER